MLLDHPKGLTTGLMKVYENTTFGLLIHARPKKVLPPVPDKVQWTNEYPLSSDSRFLACAVITENPPSPLVCSSVLCTKTTFSPTVATPYILDCVCSVQNLPNTETFHFQICSPQCLQRSIHGKNACPYHHIGCPENRSACNYKMRPCRLTPSVPPPGLPSFSRPALGTSSEIN